MSEQQLYPKPERRPPDHSDRPWAAKYRLIYDGGGVCEWTQYYHTKLGACISAWLHYHIRSWGGSVTLIDNRKEQYYG